MDPNEKLALIREKVKTLLDATKPFPPVYFETEDVLGLARSVDHLDGWLSNHGNLPTDWCR
jgi:hypothetical protein